MEARTLAGVSVLPVGRKTRALLAVVALAAPRPSLRGRLAELLWSRRPEEQARASLRQEIHRLLEALAPVGDDVLVINRDHVMLRPGAAWIDVAEVMRATMESPASLALLDGDLLEDLDGLDAAFDLWLTTERERLRDSGRTLGESLLRAQIEPELAIAAAQRLLQIDRAHEGAWRALMRAHATRGERGMAIQAYDRCRAVLADLMDAAPSAETQKVLAEIRGPSGSRLPPRPPAPTPPPESAAPIFEHEPRAPGPARGGTHVGVMPLTLVGTGSDEAHLAHGLAEEISAALSRIRWIFVVSAASLARFAEAGRDEGAIRRTFGLDFLLDGTVQRVGARMRVNLRLLDLRDGGKVAWAGRFERDGGDLLALQDEFSAQAAAQMDPEILMFEARRIGAGPDQRATPYELMLRALPLMHRMERAPFQRAGEYLRRAIESEPDLAAAHAWLGFWHVGMVGQGWADRDAMADEAGRLADRAVRLDPFDGRVLTLAAHVRAALQHELHAAAALHERALSLNPNLAIGWALSGLTAAWLGDAGAAERRLARYKALTPLHPCAFAFDRGFAIAALVRREFELAASAGRAATQMNPAFAANHKPYLAALGQLGRKREAVAALHRLLAIEPGFSVARFLAAAPFERVEDRELFAESLRLAGVPESAAPRA
ncbi:MAG TPA: BTAD domain-containing putative transcriptional regulator [Acetobacteraceae bacterium]|nr:BTAD domain-containing putative transcriptional regulator [Acetobacteraceae bacterium]